jgi:hypothetical protein
MGISLSCMPAMAMTTTTKTLYGLIPTTSTRISLHFDDGETSDQRTGRSAHTTTTTRRRRLLPGRVIALRRRSWRFHCRRRRCRSRVTTRTLGSRGGFGMSPSLLLSFSVCDCVWRWGFCDHVWREDIVECHAAVVSSSPCRPLVRAITTGGRGRCGVICGGRGGGRGALGSTAFTAHS